MRTKSLIILLAIVVFCLLHFELEALDSKSVGSSLATAATELNGNPEKKNPLNVRRNDVSRGTRKWQTYAFTNFAGSRHFNFRVVGGGGTLRVTDQIRMMGGIRYLHISDAGIEDGGGGFDGFMFYGGAMFPF